MAGMLERLRKWFQLRAYVRELPFLLRERYGRQRQYTPQQVLTTIKKHGLSDRYVAHACAMFCSKRAYSEFAERYATAGARTPAGEAPAPEWIGAASIDWPAHEDIVAQLHSSRHTLSLPFAAYFEHAFPHLDASPFDWSSSAGGSWWDGGDGHGHGHGGFGNHGSDVGHGGHGGGCGGDGGAGGSCD